MRGSGEGEWSGGVVRGVVRGSKWCGVRWSEVE